MNLFFDLDGTLLNSRKRLYTLFQDLIPESKLSIDEYWDLKRDKIDHKTILMERLMTQLRFTQWLAAKSKLLLSLQHNLFL